MKILIIGSLEQATEFREKFGEDHLYSINRNNYINESDLEDIDLLVDFQAFYSDYSFNIYVTFPYAPVLIDTSKVSLAELATSKNIACSLFGFNGLPTMLERDILETSLYKNKNKKVLDELCDKLGTKHLIVDDRVGMVTPRIIAMIINEAYYTVQEGTASKKDIDLGMKLGTNYPYGPFEWCNRIGILHVYQLLNAIYEDTKDERYKICPLLKKEYLHWVNLKCENMKMWKCENVEM